MSYEIIEIIGGHRRREEKMSLKVVDMLDGNEESWCCGSGDRNRVIGGRGGQEKGGSNGVEEGVKNEIGGCGGEAGWLAGWPTW